MVEDNFHHSVGVIRYSMLEDASGKLIVEIDPDIAYLAKALVPKHVNLNMQRFAPHVSIIRHEFVCDHPKWGLYEGASIPFEYGSYAYNNELFYWLRVRSESFLNLRRELGLPDHSKYSVPPDGTRWFHTTIGNTKRLT